MIELEVGPAINIVDSSDTVGHYSVEPLERGYGITIGNTLRRVLQSSLPGRAITTVKIEGALQLSSELPGVSEDVTDILLNLKRVRFTGGGDETAIFHLKVSGEREVTAADIQTNGEVEVANPELHIATMSEKNAQLAIEMVTNVGKGYVPADDAGGELTLGEFRLDAIFTPIEKVTYQVEQTLLGGSLNYERLLLEVQTDATITPDDALREAAKILHQHFLVVSAIGRDQAAAAAAAVGSPSGSQIAPSVGDMSIEELNLSTRTLNALRRSNVTKVRQLLAMGDQELSAIRNFGSKSVEEVKEKLREHGFSS